MFLKFRVNLREAVRSLLSSKQRTLLALLGIVIGIASVIAMVSIGTIVKNEALRQFQEMGTDFVAVRQISPQGDKAVDAVSMEVVRRVGAYTPSLTSMAPYAVVFDQCKFRGQSWSLPVLGVTGDFCAVNRLKILKGRAIQDYDREMPNCVIGDRITRELRQLGILNPIGVKLLLFNTFFTVVGCLEDASSNALRPPEINAGLLVPYGAVKRIKRLDKVDALVGRLAPQATIEDVGNQFRKALARAASGNNPEFQSAKELIEQMNKQMNLLTLLLGVVGSIALVVGGVGVMNVMLVSVSERRREIGIRRSLGAKQRDIRSQFLIESMLLCFVGGTLGILLGVGGAYGVARFQAWVFVLNQSAIWIGFGVSAAVGIFFGYYPARLASRLRIIEALRAT